MMINKEDSKLWDLAVARDLGAGVVNGLSPFCEKIIIAGSIRRKAGRVKDIEIVCLPKRQQVDLLGEEFEANEGFCNAVGRYEIIKGKPRGRYVQLLLPEGIKVDLFMAQPDNWGLILAIRTGSAEWAHRKLASQWCMLGYMSSDGFLRKRSKPGEIIPVPDEMSLFELLGMSWREPEKRVM